MSSPAATVARQWFHEVWTQRDHSAVHRLMAPDARGYMEPDLEVQGPDSFLAAFDGLLAAFPDIQVEVDEVVGDDENACVRWHAAATHVSNRPVSFRGITWLKIKDGRLVEGWDSWNQGALAATLAAAPA